VLAVPYTSTFTTGLPGGVPLDGLVLWLDAGSGVEVDGAGGILAWRDATGLANDLTQPVGALRPRLVPSVANGLPVVRLDGSTFLDREGVLGIEPDSARTFVVVYRLDDPTLRAPVLVQGQYGSSHVHFGIDANTYGTVGGRFGYYFTGSSVDIAAPTDREFGIHVLEASTLAAGTDAVAAVRYFLDGQLESGELRAGGTSASFATANRTSIGTFPGFGGQGAVADVAEVLVYDRVLTDDERSGLETLLRDKYAVGSPVPLSGLRMWLRSDEGVEVDGAGGVTAWRDSSGQGNDLMQEAGAQRPTKIDDAVRGHAVLRFDGVDDSLARGDVLGIAPDSARTLIVAAQLHDPTRRAPLLRQGETGVSSAQFGIDANTTGTAGERWGPRVSPRARTSFRTSARSSTESGRRAL
jgi:hypothetical protein